MPLSHGGRRSTSARRGLARTAPRVSGGRLGPATRCRSGNSTSVRGFRSSPGHMGPRKRLQSVLVRFVDGHGVRATYKTQMQPTLAKRSNHTDTIERTPVRSLKCRSTPGVRPYLASRWIRAESACLIPIKVAVKHSWNPKSIPEFNGPAADDGCGGRIPRALTIFHSEHPIPACQLGAAPTREGCRTSLDRFTSADAAARLSVCLRRRQWPGRPIGPSCG